MLPPAVFLHHAPPWRFTPRSHPPCCERSQRPPGTGPAQAHSLHSSHTTYYPCYIPRTEHLHAPLRRRHQAPPPMAPVGEPSVGSSSVALGALHLTSLAEGAVASMGSTTPVLVAGVAQLSQGWVFWTAIAVVLGFGYLFARNARQLDLPKVPGPWRQAVPFFGNVLTCVRPDFHRQLLDWANEYGGIYRVQFFWQPALVVTEPEALGVIMGRSDDALDKASVAYSVINPMCDPQGHANLLTAPADATWKLIRKAVAVSFSMQNIKKKFPLINSRIDRLIERTKALGDGAEVDVDQAALRVTLDVIGLAGFNHDYESVEQNVPDYHHLLRVLPRCFTEVMLRVANPFRPLFPTAFKNGPKGAHAFKLFQGEMRLLLDKLKSRGAPSEDDQDIAAQLYRVLKEHPDIPEGRILSEIGMLFVEGFETTGHTTSWTLSQIASHPEVQAKIAAELDSMGLLVTPERPVPRDMVLEDLRQLPYLTACVKEGMRMRPVVSLMGRVAHKDVRVGPYLVPKGTVVATPLFAIHNTIHNYDAPESFMPERWLSVPLETYVHNNKAAEGSAAAKGITFMPFSEGPRNCVGQSLAKMEVMTLMAKLLANFHLELAPSMGGLEGLRKRESTHLTLQTAGTQGIRCILRSRANMAA